jgi:hypothetical protein
MRRVRAARGAILEGEFALFKQLIDPGMTVFDVARTLACIPSGFQNCSEATLEATKSCGGKTVAWSSSRTRWRKQDYAFWHLWHIG